MSGDADLARLLASLEPRLNPETCVFATLPEGASIDWRNVVAAIAEPQGLSVVVSESFAREQGLDARYPCAWITLAVHSELDAVGLTAAFATALGAAGVSCNVVAGHHHDHLFVPHSLAQRAMHVLWNLQADAQRALSV